MRHASTCLAVFVALGFSGEAFAGVIINDGSLVSYWAAEEGSGITTATDSSGNGHIGTLVGDTTRGTGVFGNAFLFDGNGDYINFGQASTWNFLHNGSAFTVSGFLNVASASEGGGVLTTVDAHSNSGGRQGLDLRLDGASRIRFRIQGNGGTAPLDFSASSTFTTGSFQHFAVTYDGVGQGNIYFGGILDLFTLLASLAVWLTAESIQRRSIQWLAVTGIVIGLGALTRSILWLYLPFLALFLFVVWDGSWRAKTISVSVLLATFALTIAPWAYRNTRIQKTVTLIDVMGGRNVMMGNYEHTPLERSWATIGIVEGEDSWIRVLMREHQSKSGLTQGQIDKLAMRHGIQFMLANPGLTIKRSLVRFFNFWQLDRTLVAGLRMGYWQQLSGPVLVLVSLVIIGYYAALMYTGIFGIVLANPRDKVIHLLLLFSIAFPCLVHSAIFAHSRYHVPMMPLVVVYSAMAIVSGKGVRNQLPERPDGCFAQLVPDPFSRSDPFTRSRTLVALALCGLLTLGWIREIVMVDLARMSSQL